MNYRKKTEHEKIIGSTTKITYPNIVRWKVKTEQISLK